MGRSAEELCSEMLRVLGDQATTTPRDDSARLRLVGDRDDPIQIIRRGDFIMTALRMRARDFLNEDQLIAVRQRVTWKGVALIAHAWALILGSIALVAWWPNPLTFLLAVGIIGSRQLGLAILMHDGAHGCLSADEKINLTLSQWFCAYPIFAETRAYRRYHLQHHARTQQEDDPDLILSAPFPITGDELPPQVRARYHRADRLPAAQGAVAECARAEGMAARRSAPRISGKSLVRSLPSTP